MGRPVYGRAGFTVTRASPREVFFQAVELLGKSEQLAFEEVAGHQSEILAVPDRAPRPADVYRVVEEALARIREVKKVNEITETAAVPKRDPTMRPTDVYNAILSARRQLNLLLDVGLQPTDVYQQVAIASSYAEEVLQIFPDANRDTVLPALERRKRPADVYARLLDCFERLRRASDRAGVHILRVKRGNVDPDRVTPGDVHEVATLLVSELAYFWQRLGGDEPTAPAPHTGREWPSDVYQLAGLLESQLVELERQSELDPNRLASTAIDGGR